MPDKYKHLTKEDRRQIAEGQVRQFESEMFAHELNLDRLESIPTKERDDTHADAVKAANDAIAAITGAITTTNIVAEKLKDK